MVRRRLRQLEETEVIFTTYRGLGHSRGRPEKMISLTREGVNRISDDHSVLRKIPIQQLNGDKIRCMEHHLLTNWFRIHLAEIEYVIPELCTSIAILTELARKLDEKFGWEKEKIEQLITSISNLANTFKTSPRLKVLSNDPDNLILECALDATAEFIVTGDKHLLNLTWYQDIEIIKLSAFLAILHQATCRMIPDA